jgi:hypothetical protein
VDKPKRPQFEVAKVKCGGGCGEEIMVPKSFVEAMNKGHHMAPLCMRCLDGKKQPMAQVNKSKRRVTTKNAEASGKAPENTTLIVRKVRVGKRRTRFHFVSEVHPCAEDADVQEYQLLMQFARAMMDRARILATKDKKRIMPSEGIPRRARKRISDVGTRVLKRAVNEAVNIAGLAEKFKRGK